MINLYSGKNWLVFFIIGALFFTLIVLGSSPDISLAIESYQFVLKWGSEGSGDGQFSYPYSVAVNSSGDVYVADRSNHRIQKFDVNGNFLMKWGSLGSNDGQFYNPHGVAVDSSGNVYVADSWNYRIQKFDANGNFLMKWGSQGTGDGQFDWPYSVAVNSSGDVYVADRSNHRIQKFDVNGNFIMKWGEFGTNDGQFRYPTGIALDSSGNVYVADKTNNRIQKFNPNGVFIKKWGVQGSGEGQFNNPSGVSVDSLDNVYVADRNNHRLQKFDSSGAFITAWGSEGSGDGQFSYPYGSGVDSQGNVYVADRNNHRVQKFIGLASPSSAYQIWNSGLGNWDWSASKVTTGDFNNDGYDDVLAMYDYTGENQIRLWVWLNNKHGGFDSPQIWWDSGPSNWRWTGNALAVGDFTGDGNDDVLAFNGYAADHQARAWLYKSTGSSFDYPSLWWDSGPNNWDWEGTKLAAGDFNNDGKDDLAAFYGYFTQRQSRAFVFPSNGSGLNAPQIWWDSGPNNWDWEGTKIAAGDFNNDGKDDLAAFYGYSGDLAKIFVFPSSYYQFGSQDAWWDSGVGNWNSNSTQFLVGDFTGSDDADEFLGFYGYGGLQSAMFIFK